MSFWKKPSAQPSEAKKDTLTVEEATTLNSLKQLESIFSELGVSETEETLETLEDLAKRGTIENATGELRDALDVVQNYFSEFEQGFVSSPTSSIDDEALESTIKSTNEFLDELEALNDEEKGDENHKLTAKERTEIDKLVDEYDIENNLKKLHQGFDEMIRNHKKIEYTDADIEAILAEEHERVKYTSEDLKKVLEEDDENQTMRKKF